MATVAFPERGVYTIHPSAARTATGVSADVVNISGAKSAALTVEITATSGTDTPTLIAYLEAFDGTGWVSIVADAITSDAAANGGPERDVVNAATATGDWSGVYHSFPYEHIRLAYTITGTTPSFTFLASLFLGR